MKVTKMRVSAVLLMTLFSMAPITTGCSRPDQASEVKSGGNRVGEYRGYVAINQIIRTRFFVSEDSSKSFSLGRYFGEYYESDSGLSTLLGGFSGEALNNDFRNGTPNAMNILLWQIAFSGFAGDVAAYCGTDYNPVYLGNSIKYNDPFAARLKSLCAWPAAEAKTEENLLKLWLAVMNFDAPREEFEAWRDFFLASNSPFANAPPKDAIKAMLRAMLLSPYFLLEH